MSELVHVGFEHYIPTNRIIAIIPRKTPTSKRLRALIQEAESKGLLLDLTGGKKVKSIIIFDTGHLALAAIAAETIAGRISGGSRREKEKR